MAEECIKSEWYAKPVRTSPVTWDFACRHTPPKICNVKSSRSSGLELLQGLGDDKRVNKCRALDQDIADQLEYLGTEFILFRWPPPLLQPGNWQ
jgi:hypothetical protein